MLETSIKFIKCVKCNGKLEVNVYKNNIEIDEGVLKCKKCKLQFPIIDKTPIMFIDFQIGDVRYKIFYTLVFVIY